MKRIRRVHLLALALVASDRSMGAIVVGLVVTAIGIMAGLILASRSERAEHGGNPVGGA